MIIYRQVRIFKTTIKATDTLKHHGRHCPGDMAMRMRKVLARLWVGVRVCHLLLLFFYKNF